MRSVEADLMRGPHDIERRDMQCRIKKLVSSIMIQDLRLLYRCDNPPSFLPLGISGQAPTNSHPKKNRVKRITCKIYGGAVARLVIV